MPVVFISFYFIIRCRCCFSEISVQQFCRDSTVYVHMYESAFAYIHTVYSAPSIDCVKGGGGAVRKRVWYYFANLTLLPFLFLGRRRRFQSVKNLRPVKHIL